MSCAIVPCMQPRGRRGPAPVLAGTAVTVSLTALLMAGSVGRGQLLYRDFVTVPNPVLTARSWGFDGSAPRAVPLDAVTALLDPVVPAWVQQQVILVATLVLAGVGTAVLLRTRGVVAATVGAAVATWSPYAAERLLLGQPPTLLGWSMIPWLVLAVGRRGSLGVRVGCVVVAAIPAALTPYGGVVAAGVVLGVAALVHRAPARELGIMAFTGVLWCLPWLIPALGGRTDAGEADGAAAFAVRFERPRDVLEVFAGGGVWARGAVPESREHWLALAASAAVLGLALIGLTRLEGRRRILLTALMIGPPAVALLLATPWGLSFWAWAQSVPGVALVRDTHRLLGPAWFAVAVLAGIGSSKVAERLPDTAGPIAAGGVLVAAVSLAPLSVPDFADRLRTAYVPVAFPPAFGEMVRQVAREPVLVLPWQPMRRVAWVGPQPFLDPLPLALPGRVVTAQDLLVERDGRELRVGTSDPPESEAWSRGEVDAAALQRVGITRVVVWKGTPGRVPTRLVGLTQVLESPEYELWSVNR